MRTRLFLAPLVLALPLCIAQTATAVPLLPKHVALYGSSANADSDYTGVLDSLGYTYDFISISEWPNKTAADLEQYSAFIVADFNRFQRSRFLTPLVSNQSEWAPLVDGNMLVLGTDEAARGGRSSPGRDSNRCSRIGRGGRCTCR